jgi:hypothetical protein
MNLESLYKATEKRILALKEQGNTVKIREEQLYFTGVVMGIVAKSDNTYDTLKDDPELASKALQKGIKDAKDIPLKDNIIFEAMSYSQSLDELALGIKKDTNE